MDQLSSSAVAARAGSAVTTTRIVLWVVVALGLAVLTRLALDVAVAAADKAQGLNAPFAELLDRRISGVLLPEQFADNPINALPMQGAELAAALCLLFLSRRLIRVPGAEWVAFGRPPNRALLLAGFTAGALVFPAGLLAAGAGAFDVSAGLSRSFQESVLGGSLLFLLFLVMTATAAACEELVFRSVLLRGLMAARWRVAAALVLSAGVFAAFHLQGGVLRNLSLFAGGLGLAWAVVRTRGIELAAGLHAAFNLAHSFVAAPAPLTVIVPGSAPVVLALDTSHSLLVRQLAGLGLAVLAVIAAELVALARRRPHASTWWTSPHLQPPAP